MILEKKRWAVTLIVILSLSFVYINRNLSFNFDFENFFAEDDEDVSFYQNFRTLFEDDAQFILVGINHEKSVFDALFLEKIDALADSLTQNDFTVEVISPTSLEKVSIGPLGDFRSPLLRFTNDTLLRLDSAYLSKLPTLKNTIIDHSATKICLTLKIRDGLLPEDLHNLTTSLHQTLTQFEFKEYHIAGKLIAEDMYINRTQQELMMFSGVSALLIVVFLWLTYRSIWLVIAPLLIVSLAVLWITGFMTLTGKSLDLLMSLLPCIMFVVGVSDSIHFFSKYIEELRGGSDKKQAINNTVKQVGASTLLTSITTAIGFFTLYFINIKPIQEFGIYCGIGVLFAFVITILLLPPLLFWLPRPSLTKSSTSIQGWDSKLIGLLQLLFKNKNLVLLTSAAVTIIAVAGIQTVRVNSMLIDDLKDDDPIKKDFIFFDKYFTGARPFELALYPGDSVSTLFNERTIAELSKLETYLAKHYGVENILSPTVIVKGVNQALNSGLPQNFKLPDDTKAYTKIFKWVHRGRHQPIYELTINDSLQTGRLSGKMADIGSFQIDTKNKAFHAYVSKHIDHSVLKVRLTGSAPLIDKNNGKLAENMMIGLFIAFVIIAMIMGVLFKSLRMMFIALIPNMIPLLILGAIMGFGAIDLKLSTSIVFTVAFGIAVDDTIHFMARYRFELQKGKSKLYAIKRTYISTGKALIVTSFILSAGFLSLVLSSFMGTFYTGLFVSLTLLFALISDLFLLPILLLLVDKK